MNDTPLNAIDIARLLDETAVDHVHYLPETSSTNEVALGRAAQIPPHESELVLTSRQLAGRGRGQNRWHASEGALTWSLITPRLPLPREQTPRVSLTAGLAICLAAEQAAPSAQTRLKWPNDVYLNGRKAAGILIESPAGAVDRFVIGVGMNVNNRFDDAPQEVRERAASLAEATGAPLSLTEVLILCLNRWEDCLGLLLAGSSALADQWNAYSFLEGRELRLALPNESLTGVCRGIAADGALLLGTDQGERPCYGGVVEWFQPGD